MKRILITGASEGIGLAVAQLLAAEGAVLTLVARSADKLAAAQRALPGTGHLVLVADLSVAADVELVAEHLAETSYDVLINNAGAGLYGRFEALPLDQQLRLMQLNMTAVVQLSHRFLARARPGDALVNVASFLALTAMPGAAVYAATKAFVLNFSESLWQEWEAKGVYVLGFNPGVTSSNFHQASGGSTAVFPPAMMQTPAQVAQELVRALRLRRQPRVVSGWVTRLLVRAQLLLPRRAGLRLMGRDSLIP
ncbi:MAG: SDR family NAD(P)-dependent oxidoreductase [Janthinobacterium lividum]